MKKVLFPLLLAIATAVITYMLTTWMVAGEAQSKAGFEVGLKDLQLEYMSNNAMLRPILDMEQRPDLQKYLNEVNTLTNWYFKNPVKEFWDKQGLQADPERIIKEYRAKAEVEGKGQKSAQGNLPIREECYKLTREIYDQLQTGTYKAVASDFQGSVRFDVHKVVKEDNKLNWIIVAWGGIGDLVYDGWHLRMYKAATPEEIADYEKEVKRAKRRREEPEMPDPRSQHFAETAAATKAPRLPIFDGSTYVDDFPAGAEINYITTPTCHPEAEEIEMKFKIKARALAGDDQPMEFVFRMPVDSAWKGSWDGVKTIEAASDY